jgi:uncharacterized protein involved in exopolysaccharide biosynthesis
VLQTLRSDEIYRQGESTLDFDRNLNLVYYLNILKIRIFYFLGVFGLVSVLGLYLAAVQKPTYLSEGKVLVQSQEITPDFFTPASLGERVQLIQQLILTRAHLLSTASKFGLFPRVSEASEIVDLMRKRIQIKPVPLEVDGQLRPNSHAIAFTVGFEYEDPALAMRVANEFISSIVSGDERSRSGQTAEMIKVLASQTKDIEGQLESTQTQMLEVARRSRDKTPEMAKSQLTALAALKAELIQKTSVYSDAHPVVSALKKRIAVMEKNLVQTSQLPTKVQSTSDDDDDMEALKRQRIALEKQLAEASAKLANARLREKPDLEQQQRMQVIELPSLPEKPVKSKRILIVAMAFAAAAVLGLGLAIGPDLLNGPIRSRHQLIGVVASDLVVCIPYVATHADIIRSRLRSLFIVASVITILIAWGALAAAIVFHLPVHFLPFDKAEINVRATDR